MPFQAKSTGGKGIKNQLRFLTALELRAETVSVQMQLACRIATDAPAQLVAFVNLDQAQHFGERAINDG
jgi:hypothetical protein